MAKENRENRPAKARVFFGYAEFDGADQGVVENVRALAASVVRSLQGPQPIRPVMKELPNKVNGKPKDEEKGLYDDLPEVVEQTANDEDGDVLGVEQPAAPAAPKEPRPPKKPPQYAFVSDLNLRPDDKQHLKAFYAEKKPQDQMEQLAVIVFYLAKILEVQSIGANHLYTCFNEVEERVPKNILQSVNNTKARRGWLDAVDPFNIRITTGGENLVKHDLPKKPAV